MQLIKGKVPDKYQCKEEGEALEISVVGEGAVQVDGYDKAITQQDIERDFLQALNCDKDIKYQKLLVEAYKSIGFDVNSEVIQEVFREMQISTIHLAVRRNMKDLEQAKIEAEAQKLQEEKMLAAATERQIKAGSRTDSSWKAEGLKTKLHGEVFQLALLTIAATRAARNSKPFYLISEAAQHEKFDDLVIDYGDTITFLQAKHSADGDSYAAKDFCSDTDGDASLAKYFDSWMTLESGDFVKKPDKKSKKETRYILFTNRQVTDCDFIVQDPITDDEFDFGEKHYTCTFKQGPTRQQFIDAIKLHSKIIQQDTSKTILFKKDGHTKLKPKVLVELKQCLLQEDSTGRKTMRASILKQEPDLKQFFEALDKGEIQVDISGIEENESSKHTVSKFLKTAWKGLEPQLKEARKRTKTTDDFEIQIKQFLDLFVVKVWQPNKDDLLSILRRELRVDVSIGAEEFYNSVSQYMLNWFSARHQCLLRSEDFGRFSQATAADLQRFYLLGETKRFEESFRRVVSKYTIPHIEGLEAFLFNEPSQHVAVVVGEGAKYRVYQTIGKAKIDGMLKDAEWFFLGHNDGKLEQICEILTGPSTKIVVVQYSDNILPHLNGIVQAVVNEKKKLLLLTLTHDAVLEQQSFAQAMRRFDSRELSDAHVREVCRQSLNNFVEFAGKSIKVQEILDEFSGVHSGIYGVMKNLDRLITILDSSDDQGSNEAGNIYVANDIERGVPYYDLRSILCIKDVCFVVDRVVDREIREKIAKYFESKDHKHITDKLVSATVSGKASIKIIRVESDHVFAEAVAGVSLPIPLGYDFGQAQPVERNQLFGTGVLSVISANAGFGKTSFCINVQESWIAGSYPDVGCIIRVNLPMVKFGSDFFSVLTESATGYTWKSWQYAVLKSELKVNGRVVILADGLDEVKNEHDVEAFNRWLESVPSTASLLVTTRQYAANKIKIPASRRSMGYFTLQEYTPEQQKEYLKQYIEKFLREKNAPIYELSNELIKKLYSYLSFTNSNARKMLGIPLESYIFCESIKPYVAQLMTQEARDVDLKKIFGGQNSLNSIILYQKFVEAKLLLFLGKHLKISSVSLELQHRLYSLSASYNELLMIFAFRQTFGLEYSFVLSHLLRVYHTPEMITHDLQDIGIISLEVLDGEYYFRFIHKTYQEYFAAVFMLRGIVYDASLRDLLVQNMYDPQYRVVISIMGQLSIAGSPIIPGFDLNRKEHTNAFWKLLIDRGDVLGAAALKLVTDCTAEIAEQSKTDYLCRHKWLLQGYKDDEGTRHLEDLPFERKENELTGVTGINVIDISRLKEKSQVLDHVKSLIAGGVEKKTIREKLLEVMRSKTLNVWWNIDGGFESLILLGDSFDNDCAKEFIRLLDYGHHSVTKAIEVLRQFYIMSPSESARKAGYMVVYNLQLHHTDNDIISLIKVISIVEYLSFLKEQYIKEFESHLRKGAKALCEEACAWKGTGFTFPVGALACIIATAWQTAQPVFIESDTSVRIRVVNEDVVVDTRYKITIRDFSKIRDKLLIHALVKNVVDTISAIFIEEYERYLLTESLKIFKDIISSMNKDDLGQRFFPKLAEYNLIDAKLVECFVKVAKDKTGYWHSDAGIPFVGLTGKYFSRELAQYSIAHSSDGASSALSRIHYVLQSTFHDELFNSAVNAYNECIQNKVFSESGLTMIKQTPAASGVAGDVLSPGSPMMLGDLHANAKYFGIPVVRGLPDSVAGSRYLLIDSANIVRSVGGREDVRVVCLDIQGGTASCGDNALVIARKAQQLGYGSFVYVNEGHATAVIRYNTGSDQNALLRDVTNVALKEDGSWGRYTAAMGYPEVQSHSSEALVSHMSPIHRVHHVTGEDRLLHLLDSMGMMLEEAMSDRGFRQASLKLHPDKGGDAEVFKLLNEMRDSHKNQGTSSEPVVQDIGITIQRGCYQASLIFKAADIGINTVRAYNNPTAHNIANVAVGGSHLLSMATGVTYFSTAASIMSTGYAFYEGGFYEGAKSATISVVFMAVPSVLILTGAPYIATAYTVALTAYTGYHLVDNAWSLYNELSVEVEHAALRDTNVQAQCIDDVQNCNTNSTYVQLTGLSLMDLERIDVVD